MIDFEIFPAIDLLDGSVVRLYQGDYGRETIFSTDPVDTAKKWEDLGASRIHIVDLNGAREGSLHHINVIDKMVNKLSIPVQLGGGLRTMESVNEVLNLGVQRVILGSVILADPDLISEAITRFGDSIICGLDAKNGFIMVQGWEKASNSDVFEVAEKLSSIGAQRFIYTDISRDGTMEGPNIDSLSTFLAFSSPSRVIASGGVSSIKDVLKLSTMGLEGVIIGKSLYSGAIDFTELTNSINR